MTRAEALAAVRAELTPEVRAELDGAPDDVLADVADTVATGMCSPAQAAEALTLAIALGDATLRGELVESRGLELMGQIANRHRGELRRRN